MNRAVKAAEGFQRGQPAARMRGKLGTWADKSGSLGFPEHPRCRPEMERKARLTVCQRARSVVEARMLLDMLGLLDGRAPGDRSMSGHIRSMHYPHCRDVNCPGCLEDLGCRQHEWVEVSAFAGFFCSRCGRSKDGVAAILGVP
jgi:hypothetical protein